MLTYATKQKHEKKTVLESTAWHGAASLSKQKRSTACNLCVNLDWDRCYFYPHRRYWNIWNAWTPGWEGSRRFTLWAGTLYVLLRGWHKLPFGNADVALLCRLQMLTSHNQQLCHKVGRALPFTLLCALTLCKPRTFSAVVCTPQLTCSCYLDFRTVPYVSERWCDSSLCSWKVCSRAFANACLSKWKSLTTTLRILPLLSTAIKTTFARRKSIDPRHEVSEKNVPLIAALCVAFVPNVENRNVAQTCIDAPREPYHLEIGFLTAVGLQSCANLVMCVCTPLLCWG